MLNLQFPTGTKFEISGLNYELTDYPILDNDKYAFDRYGKDPIDGKYTLVEAFDVFKSPTSENKYQIRHHYYNSLKQWTNDTVWFTLAEIRKNGLQHLLENWPIF